MYNIRGMRVWLVHDNRRNPESFQGVVFSSTTATHPARIFFAAKTIDAELTQTKTRLCTHSWKEFINSIRSSGPPSPSPFLWNLFFYICTNKVNLVPMSRDVIGRKWKYCRLIQRKYNLLFKKKNHTLYWSVMTKIEMAVNVMNSKLSCMYC